MGDHRLLTHEGHVGIAGERGKTWAEGKENEWTDCVAEDCRVFDITGDWGTAALGSGVWNTTVS